MSKRRDIEDDWLAYKSMKDQEEKDKKRLVELKKFAKEVKLLTRDVGRTNFILKRDLEELIVKYDVSLVEE